MDLLFAALYQFICSAIATLYQYKLEAIPMAILSQPLSLDLSALAARPTLAPVARAAIKLAVVLMHWDEAYRSRQTLKALSSEQLRDVGLTRQQATDEAKRGFWSL